MSLHPNDIARRARIGSLLIVAVMAVLLSAFFKTQVVEHERYALQSEENRLRAVPLPAPRGTIYDRRGEVIAENLPAYTVAVLAPNIQALQAELRRLGSVIQLTDADIRRAERIFRRDPNRPTVIFPDASIDVVAVLEEHRIDFPSLIIQSVPKRYYPDGPGVATFVGYTGEITESELNQPRYAAYKMGQQVGKGGLEKQYEEILHGKEGMSFVEVDARGRVVRDASQQPGLAPEAAPALHTNIDLALQRFAVAIFGDSLVGGVIALEPTTGAVLAMHSAPSFDPNRFIGGIPTDYWQELNTDPKRPLYNKVIQGTYPPGSTWKLATALTGLTNGLVDFDDKMPLPCSGGLQFGARWFRCWEERGHGYKTLQTAIEQSCDVYFYQLGLRVGLARLIAGGVTLGMREKSGLDVPDEKVSRFPYAVDYYNKRYGPRGWTNAVVLNLSIGQGENSQTVANMAKFYSALATDGRAATPQIVRRPAHRERLYQLTPDRLRRLRESLAGVVSSRGTAGGSRIEGVVLAGKTGTSQTGREDEEDHAWFLGFAPAEEPKILVSVMLEHGGHGWRAARIASAIISYYLKVAPTETAAITAGG
jgi:penicillin-binding protein 2